MYKTKIIFFLNYLLFLILFPVMSADRQDSADFAPSLSQLSLEDSTLTARLDKIYTYNNVTLNEAATVLNELIRSHINPEEVLLILDVDGVLTAQSIPSLDPFSYVTARSNIVDWIKFLREKGVNIVASSAWNRYELPFLKKGFHETVRRLKNLGLTDVLSLQSESETKTTTELREFSAEGNPLIPIFSYSNGNCCSVTADQEFCDAYKTREELTQLKEPYFRHKALAAYVLFPLKKLKKIKYVFFLDDSLSNTTIFEKTVREYGLYKKAHVYIYTVKEPKDVEEVEDRIKFDE